MPRPWSGEARRPVRAPVPAEQLLHGIEQAQRAVARVVERLSESNKGTYGIAGVDIVATFGDDGSFLGFGGAGAVSLRLRLVPGAFEDEEGEAGDEIHAD